MNMYYIGVRCDHSEMNELLGSNVGKLNNKLSDSLRSAARTLGIQKTQGGKRLEFYSVDADTLADLLDPAWRALNQLVTDQNCRPLVTVDQGVLSNNLDAVNSRYPARMDSATHGKYKADLARALEESLTRVGDDLPRSAVTKTTRYPANPLQVGDIIPYNQLSYGYTGYRHARHEIFDGYGMVMITRVGKRDVRFRRLLPVGHSIWSNTDTVTDYFNEVITWNPGTSTCSHGHVIPLSANESTLEWRGQSDGQDYRMPWYKLVSKNITRDDIQGTQPAYCFSYEPSWD